MENQRRRVETRRSRGTWPPRLEDYSATATASLQYVGCRQAYPPGTHSLHVHTHARVLALTRAHRYPRTHAPAHPRTHAPTHPRTRTRRPRPTQELAAIDERCLRRINPYYNRTPMWIAAESGHLDIMEYLLERQAGTTTDVRTKDKFGWTPLYVKPLPTFTPTLTPALMPTLTPALTRTLMPTLTPTLTPTRMPTPSPPSASASSSSSSSAPPAWPRPLTSSLTSYLRPRLTAIDNGHLECAKFLYENGAHEDIHTPELGNFTPVFKAVSQGNGGCRV